MARPGASRPARGGARRPNGAAKSAGKSGKSGKSESGKQRWTSEQRTARGLAPRRGGARPDDRQGQQRSRGADAGTERGWQGDAKRARSWSDEGRESDRRGDFGSGKRSDRRDDRPRGRDDRFDRRDDRRDDRRGDRPRGRDDRYERRNDRFGDNRGFDRRDERRDDRPRGRDDRSEHRNDRFGDNRGQRFDRRDDRGFDRRDDRGGERRFDRRDDRDDRGYSRRDERPFASRPVNDHHARRDDWRRPARPRRMDADPRERFEDRGRNHADDVMDTMEWNPHEIELSDDAVDRVDATAGFAALGVPAPLVAALSAQGIDEPFPIQAATIPDALTGRDVLGRGRTGSGKTLGFGLPMVARVAASDPSGGLPRALVLVPTRELALQVADVLAPLARTMKLDLVLVAGGMSYGPQLRAFERGVDIVVATPGRLIDLMDQGAADLGEVRVTVLDEADHMADLGFLPEVTRILDAVPGDGQRLLFSATLDHAVDRIVRQYLHDPITHQVDENRAAVTTMDHLVLLVKPADKEPITAEIANREGRTLIFVRTQMGANRVAEQLREHGVMAGALHGGLTQGARARILQAFRDGTVPVLVATDVAARGIHVDDVSLVLQVDPPMNAKDYLHRAGRTARAGETGVVVSLALPHQRRSTSRLLGAAGAKHHPQPVVPGDELLAAQTGARQPSDEAIPESDYLALIAPKQQVRKKRPQGGGFQKQGGGFQKRGRRDYGRRPRFDN